MKNEKHIHTYDENGKMTCCSLEEKIERSCKKIGAIGKNSGIIH